MTYRRIALVSDAVLPFNKGGKETRIDYMAKALAMLGYDVHIYTMQWWQGSKTKIIGPLTYHAISPLYPLYDGDRRSIREGVLFGVACLKLVFARFDILEVDHMPFFPLFSAKVVAVLRHKPLFATWHEVWGKEYWKTYMGGRGSGIAAAIETVSVRLPNHITAVSKFTFDQLQTVLHYKGSLSLVNNGIDSMNMKSIVPDQNHYDVLYAGRLLTHKNVDVLIRAMAIVHNKLPLATCAIVGDGPEFDHLGVLVNELGLSDTVSMLGFLEANEAIYALMKSAKMFVLPSSREGFGISLLEAAACGASVVTVDEPENAAKNLAREIGGDVVACTPEAIANSIIATISARGTKRVKLSQCYDWHMLAQRMSEVYGV